MAEAGLVLTMNERKVAHDDLSLLIGQASSGDTHAFELIVRRFERNVLTTAFRLLGNLEDAQDSAQEVFLKIHRHLERFDGERKFEPWLYRVTVNVCRDHWRRQKTGTILRSEMPDQVADGNQSTGNPHRRLRAEEDKQLLYQALAKLPEKERAAIVLRDLQGFSTAEVAEILGSSEVTVRSQISKARVRIKKEIEKMPQAMRKQQQCGGNDDV
jgi:RNA polymerase sigma-70 factor (ECF subfamily)